MQNTLLQQFEESFGVKVEKYEDKEYRIGSADVYSLGVGFLTQGGRAFRGVYEVDIQNALPVIMKYQLKECGMLGSGCYKSYWNMIHYTRYYDELIIAYEEYPDCETEEEAMRAYFDEWPETMIKESM